MDELRQKAAVENTGLREQFIAKTLDELETVGDLSDPIPMSVRLAGKRGRNMSFDAYGYDEADSSLVMIACDFNENNDVDSWLNGARIAELCRYMTNFIDESVNGDMQKYSGDNVDAIHLAREFKNKIGEGSGMYAPEILRFKLYIITNSVLSRHVKDLTQEDFLGRPVTLNVWTLERFYQSYVSDISEIIEFDTEEFGCEGLQYLKADLGREVDYDAYMAIVPGQFLANLYLRYGSRLLQGNIRAFLSVRGKVNKGIRNTIINEPANFFTYNNGIAVVARSVGLSKRGDKITHFKDFQIINGGQTTASLANVIIRKEDKNGMDSLFVPMKLTVMNVDDDMSEEQSDKFNSIIKTISKCANSQNAVSDADFFSNHPFHTVMESLSNKVIPPCVGGRPYATKWFYERSRGKWEQEQMKLTPAEVRDFREHNPKKQIIKKEKLAKCLSAFYKNPHQSCMASVKCFKLFALTIENIYDNSRERINEVFFKRCVCSIIVYDAIDEMVANATWYPKNGTKMDVVAYTIAKLMSLIPEKSDFDWIDIWNKQCVYPTMMEELRILSHETYIFLEEEAKGRFIHDVSKLESTWQAYKEIEFRLTDAFKASLISVEETREYKKSAEDDEKFKAGVDNSVDIFRRGGRYWMGVYNDLRTKRILSYGDVELIKGIALRINSGQLPTTAQCRRLQKVKNKAAEGGYNLP